MQVCIYLEKRIIQNFTSIYIIYVYKWIKQQQQQQQTTGSNYSHSSKFYFVPIYKT